MTPKLLEVEDLNEVSLRLKLTRAWPGLAQA